MARAGALPTSTRFARLVYRLRLSILPTHYKNIFHKCYAFTPLFLCKIKESPATLGSSSLTSVWAPARLFFLLEKHGSAVRDTDIFLLKNSAPPTRALALRLLIALQSSSTQGAQAPCSSRIRSLRSLCAGWENRTPDLSLEN